MDRLLNSRAIFLRDRGQSSLAEELLRLRGLEFGGNYGDYLAEKARALRTHAGSFQPTMPVHYSISAKNLWTEIAAKHGLEIETGADPKKGVQGAVIDICYDNDWDVERMLWVIQQYGSRNELMHNNCDVFIQKKQWTRLAVQIHRDLKDLPNVTPRL